MSIIVHVHIHPAVIGVSVVSVLPIIKIRDNFLPVIFQKRQRRHTTEVLRTISEPQTNKVYELSYQESSTVYGDCFYFTVLRKVF